MDLHEGLKKHLKLKNQEINHISFLNFLKNFNKSETINQNLKLNLQHVSNKKYLKLYKIESNLVDYETEVLENSIDYSLIMMIKIIFFL